MAQMQKREAIKMIRYFRNRKIARARAVAELISEYYELKNNYDYNETLSEINALGICSIEAFMNTITITLRRPGLLIGKAGVNITNLEKHIFSHSKYTKLNIKEDRVLWALIPNDYADDEIS